MIQITEVAPCRADASAPDKPTDDLLFRHLLCQWLMSGEGRRKGSTENKYEYLIRRHILPELGEIPVEELSPRLLNDFLRRKLEEGRLDGRGGLAASYVRSIMLILRAAMEYGQARGMCPPVGMLFKPPLEQKPLIVLELEQQRQLESHLLQDANPCKLGIFLALQTGLRIGEVCALAWEDVDLAHGLLQVRHTVVRVRDPRGPSGASRLILDAPKTKTSRRTIPISARLLSILSEAYEKRRSDYLASDRPGFISPRTFDYRYRRIMENCGLSGINFHILRHSFATRCMEAGMDIKTLSELLGHASTTTTLNIYVHSSLERKRKQLEKLSAYLL